MKRVFGIVKTAAAAALSLLLFAACINPLISSRRDNALAQGKGLVRIETTAGTARTAMPSAVFDHYEYLFSKGGEPAESKTPDGPGLLFALDPGNWRITIKAYAGSDPETLAAEGSEDFTINPGAEATVTVKLSPALGEETGTLSYALTFPSGAEVRAFTLTLLAGDDGTNLAGASGPLEIASGYYLARASLIKDGIPVEKTEVVHIYKSLTTELALAFDDADFRAFVALSSADSGPGTLRQALTDAMAGNGGAIMIDLPANDRVITLKSPLPEISKSIVLEGNGTVLTQKGITPSATSQLLRITGGNSHIRRLHFNGAETTGNGGAVSAGSDVILESCIFSDNSCATTNMTDGGGAIYSSAHISVLGCTFYNNTTGGYGGAIFMTSFGGLRRLALTGNIFWGNSSTHNYAANHVVYAYIKSETSIEIVSSGFNVSDRTGVGDLSAGDSGWAFTSSDKKASRLPVSFVSFRPLGDGDAINVITDKPLGYPDLDFYGEPIPSTGGAAGAAQTATAAGGFILDYAALGLGEVKVTGGTVDSDGLSSGAISLTASDGEFRYWIVDGVKQAETSNVLTVTMDAHKTVRAMFFVEVSSSGDSGPGTLREAILSGTGGVILQGQTITLTSPLNTINRDFVLEGNGATLTQTGFMPGAATQLLYIAGGEVRISRVHFKGGRTTGSGGALYNAGSLTLESCIFSDNSNTIASGNNGGGAIYSAGALTVLGCTFYGNATGRYGGAIYQSGSTSLSLTGNVFWGNTAASYPVVGKDYSATVASGGFNVSDEADGASNSGWNFEVSDIQANYLPVSSVSFGPIGGGEAIGVITTKPGSYPAQDFYGVDIPAQTAAAGAVQTPTATGLNMLDYAALGPGELSIPHGIVDSDGLTSAPSVALTAAANPGGQFIYWTVNGVKQAEESNELTVTMDGHKTVRAVFYAAATSAGNSGPGSLREVLAAASDGSGIFLAVPTITLSSPLDPISKSIIIEGNGATLTQNGFAEGDASQLLSIASAGSVRVSRLHFKGGRATNYGAAINNAGTLVLESCVFSDNVTSAAGATGGAIYATGITTVFGCTFYGNKAGAYGGGAIYRSGSTSLALTGNVFWGNTGGSYPVVRVSTGSASSGGYNISDKAGGTGSGASGWAFANGDKQAPSLPFSFISFRPIGGGAAINAIATSPAGYPGKDFYGAAIPSSGAAAGAAQTATTGIGYILDYAAQGPGEVEVTNGTVDSDGFASGSVSLKAVPNGEKHLLAWIVDDAFRPEQTLTLDLSISAHTKVRAVFGDIHTANNNDSGTGSLREALTKALAAGGAKITLPAGQTITLNTPLPELSTFIVIEGNGATLTQAGFTPGSGAQLLRINSSATVRIGRLHFKGGRASYGAAIDNAGKLALESCIFSDNRATNGDGGAISNGGNVTVSGCTFYGNSASDYGGAISQIDTTASLTLTGNVFWGNTAVAYPVIDLAVGTFATGGYNVSDKPAGFYDMDSGWDFNLTNPDTQASILPVSSLSFKPLSGSSALGAIVTRPGGYPEKDFYDVSIPETTAAAGAVQTATAPGAYMLDYASQGGPGEVTIPPGILDADGLTSSASVTLTAKNIGDSVFIGWIVNGIPDTEQSNTLTLTMDGHKTVRAVFAVVWTVSSGDNDGDGSLREALTGAASGDYIVFDEGLTVTLTSILPQITESLVIEGNGATLTQTGFTPGNDTHLLYINSTSADVRISRLRFTGGRVASSSYGGGAIRNMGTLTLESCIFSDNQSTSDGGAIYASNGSLTVLGCTFFENKGYGGAIYRRSGSLALTGNVFWGNTGSYPVVYGSGISSGGYNVSDKPGGTGSGASGWTFTNGDIQLTGIDFDSQFKPSHASLPSVPSISGFPASYFNGSSRGTTPGAMPAQ
jgi:predicted outer membrane repeat protein